MTYSQNLVGDLGIIPVAISNPFKNENPDSVSHIVGVRETQKRRGQ